MAILTFDMEEGELEGFSPDGEMLAYHLLFSHNRGWLHCEKALQYAHRIRAIRPEEAGALAQFLMRAGVLSEFKQRCAPEDWARLLEAMPEPAAALA